MKIVVGLGNPGDRYKNTRHNLGFAVLDEYAKKHLGPEVVWTEEEKFKSEILKINYTLNAINYPLILVKPQTFMNNSGLAVSKLAFFYKINPEDLIIVHDELDLPLGKIKIRQGGAAAGHHGVESIMDNLHTDQFIRIRLGIGNIRSQRGEKGLENFGADKFVTEEFLSSEKPKVKHMLKQAVEALDILLEEGLEKAQNQFN